MRRKFVIGDVHGGFLALTQVIELAKIKKEDTLIFLGDYVDGWSQSPEVLNLLIDLDKKHNCIFIKGNHDQLFLDWLMGKKEKINLEMWKIHGGKATIDSYKNVSKSKINEHITFLSNLKTYFIDDNNNLYVHAGFTNMKGVHHEYFEKTFYWDRTLWETALALNPDIKTDSILYPKRFNIYKSVYIGHTPVTLINETTPQNRANIWNVDTGAAFKGVITIMDIDTKQYWQSDPLNKLYPNEKGRN